MNALVATALDLPYPSPGGSVELFLDLYTGAQPAIPARAFMLAPDGPRPRTPAGLELLHASGKAISGPAFNRYVTNLRHAMTAAIDPRQIGVLHTCTTWPSEPPPPSCGRCPPTRGSRSSTAPTSCTPRTTARSCASCARPPPPPTWSSSPPAPWPTACSSSPPRPTGARSRRSPGASPITFWPAHRRGPPDGPPATCGCSSQAASAPRRASNPSSKPSRPPPRSS